MVPNVLVVPGIVVPAGHSLGVAIPIGHRVRGVLSRLYVVQTAGTLAGFSYAIYAAAHSCPVGADPAIPADAGIYNLVPALVVPSTKADYQGQLAWPSDGINHLWQPYSTGPDRQTGADANAQQLYLWISAGGSSGNATFSASVTVGDQVYT